MNIISDELQYNLQENVIYNVDCVQGMRMQIPDNSIDIVITSPPYNLGVKYDVHDDMSPWDEYYDWCRLWMNEVYRILKPDGRFCLNHYLSCGTAKHRSAPLMNLNAIAEFDIGFKHHGVALWSESSTCKRQAWGSWVSASAPYINSPHECIDIFYKDHWKKDKKGESTITSKEFMESTLGIWHMAPERKRKNGHCPAPFPVALPKRCINLLSYKGDIVLDPFSGNATTAIAAIQTGRRYIGFELSKTYWDFGNERIKEEINKERI